MSDQPYTYLRLSVTDQCNFNCFYCQPRMRRDFIGDDAALTAEQIVRLAGIFCAAGVRHVRLTGGEPLLRPDFEKLLSGLSSQEGLERLSLTTNGFRLASMADLLRRRRVRSVNVSLDTLNRERFARMTGLDALPEVKKGILAARSGAEINVKLNVLLIKGFNNDEILDFIDFGRRCGCDVRFIEYFPTRRRSDAFRLRYVSTAEVKAVIEARYGALEFLGRDPLAGPAVYYRIAGLGSRVGFISSVTGFFCGACNRLRLTADGKLYACLHSDYHADLRPALDVEGATAAQALISEVMSRKKEHTRASCRREFEMSAIGG